MVLVVSLCAHSVRRLLNRNHVYKMYEAPRFAVPDHVDTNPNAHSRPCVQPREMHVCDENELWDDGREDEPTRMRKDRDKDKDQATGQGVKAARASVEGKA